MSQPSADQRLQKRWNAGDLNLTNGLLVVLDLALSEVEPGEIVIVDSSDPAGSADLQSWCKLTGHAMRIHNRANNAIEYHIVKGNAQNLLLDGVPRQLPEVGTKNGISTRALSELTEVPAKASPTKGFAPRGAALELHSPKFPFSLNDKHTVWCTEIAELYDQAVANQWNADRDIAWSTLPKLPEVIERSLCQVLTFLVENEFAALYVPGKFVSRINPQYTEVVLFLSTQMMDEARHIEAFTKRALANGCGMQVCTASTEHSLRSLLEQSDFSSATFLLSVLGEGTFVDLLKFIEDAAPDAVTADIMRRARVDETRHVHFGMAHTKYLLSQEPEAADKLILAVAERARVLHNTTSINELVTRALIILSGGGIEPEQLKSGSEKVSSLLAVMDENRRKRLQSIGLSAAQAAQISGLHTPNFM